MVTSILDILNQKAKHQTNHKAFIFLKDGESESNSLTYGELERQAKKVAAYLQSWQGERALLLYPSGLEFIIAFFGCLYAGVTAVPVYPPRRSQKLSRLLEIASDAKAKLALTTQLIQTDIQQKWKEQTDLTQLKWVASDAISADDPEFVSNSFIPESLAFLQYTSGSTGEPKGVMVTHANLLHNLQVIQKAFGHNTNTIGVGWLPLFHDMGLIGNVLQPLYLGITSVLMPPAVFLQKPIRWLEAISRYQATTSGGPNFAYDLCIEKIEPEALENLDLSSWKVAFNGSEPIQSATIDKFARKFEAFGFRRQAFYPCYGMAESTLFVTGGQSNLSPVTCCIQAASLKTGQIIDALPTDIGSKKLVSSGHSWLNQDIHIVEPESLKPLPENQVGEIWVSSSSVAKGYWNRPEETTKTLKAYLKDNKKKTFLRTGDLGYVRNGELFVTGRLKDIIIIRGQNYYPQDIEQSVENSHPALRPNSTAAFSIEIEGEEKLVVIQEIKRTHLRKLNREVVVEAINKAVSLEHELAVESIVLLKPGSIDKTSSGKIQRHACRQKFLAGNLKGAIISESISEAEKEAREMKFSLLYFSSNEASFKDDKYQLLLEGAKFADQNNFHAVWIPERHFHPFGGLYPEPSILGGVLAHITQKIRIRPGSVVLPLQNPVRVAEKWSVVDNLSQGRVDISFARGWNHNDFVLAPENYTDRTQIMFDGIKTVQKLWRGESICLANGKQEETKIKIYPSPKQTELPTWVTCSGGKERFIEAGAIGANVLTALLFQTTEELAEKITAYRESRAENGHDPSTGHVTIMLHTFVSSEIEFVLNQVEKPFKEYLASSVDLWKDKSQELDKLAVPEREKILDFAFERYFKTAALFGTPTSCLPMINRLKAIGIDEIACLIDFGIDTHTILKNLPNLNQLHQLVNQDISSQVNLNNQLKKQKLNTENIDEAWIDNSESILQDENYQLTINLVQRKIVTHLKNFLEKNLDKITVDNNFFALGIDSIKAIEVMDKLSEDLKFDINPTLIFEYQTIIEMSNYLVKTYEIETVNGLLVCHKEPHDLEESIKKDIVDKSKNSNYLSRNNLAQNKRVIGKL